MTLPQWSICLATTTILYALPLIGEAQTIPFASHEIDCTFSDPWATGTADINGDGHLDVLAAQQSGEAVWYENGGNGASWTEHVIQEDGDASGHWWQGWSIFAADFDNDGDQDIVGGSGSWGPQWAIYELNWWENTAGDGSSWTRHMIDIEDRSVTPPHLITLYWAEPGDINADGAMDIAVANYDSIWVYIQDTDAFGNPLGTFQGILYDDKCYGAHAAHPAQLDCDPGLEVVAAAYYTIDPPYTWEGGVAIYGLDNASFKHILSDQFSGAFSVDTLDMDLDGDLDVVASGSDGIRTYENPHDPTCPVPPPAPIWLEDVVQTYGNYSVKAADIDGDGDEDIVTGGDNVYWFSNDPNGVGINWNYQFIFGDVDVMFYAPGDINNDGKVDIAGVLNFLGLVKWYENDEDPANSTVCDPYGGYGGGYGGGSGGGGVGGGGYGGGGGGSPGGP